MSTTRGRTAKRFSWSEPSPALTRALLIALYERGGREKDDSALRTLGDRALAKQAGRAFGSPPKQVHLDKVADVLVDRWLPTLLRSELDDLAWEVQVTLSGPDKTASFATRAALLEFFG